MNFAGLQHKLRFLSLSPEQHVIRDIHTAVKTVMQEHSQSPAAPSWQQALALDISYFILRHVTWLRAPIFPEVLMEFLSNDYHINRQLAGSLLENTFKVLPPHLQAMAGDENTIDQSFLKYIFIAAATAHDEEKLIADLGLGTSLLTRIRTCAENVMHAQKAPVSVTFEPHMEQIMSGIIVDLAEELKVTPWIFDEHRLGFTLWDLDFSLWATQENDSTRKIFQLLLTIGKTGDCTHEQMYEHFHKLFPQAKAPQKTSCDAMLQMLRAKELVYQEVTHRLPRVTKWSLTPLGQEITADAYACKLLRMNQAKIEHLPQLNPHYQFAVIQRLGPDHLKDLLLLIEAHLTKFSPRAITAAIHQLSRSVPHSELFSLLKPTLMRRDIPWLRAAMCDGLPALFKENSVGLILADMARSDESKRVQESAQLALHKWQAKQVDSITRAS